MNEFKYVSPKSLEKASNLLTEKNSYPYAGGTDALSLIKHKTISPEKVVNLKKIEGLDKIEYQPGKGFTIGTMVRIADIASHPDIKNKATVLAEAAGQVASPQLRNMGTLGGNLCQRPRCWYFRGDFHCLRKGGDVCYAYDGENKYHCIAGGDLCYIVHPSDTAVALKALDAELEIYKDGKKRTVSINDFFVLPDENIMAENILQPGEIVTHVKIKEQPANSMSGYLKFKERDVWDFAVVSVAVNLQKDGNRIKTGKISYGGVAPVPWSEAPVNQFLVNMEISEEQFKALAAKGFTDAVPLAQNGYKVPLARNLTVKLLRRLLI